MIEQAVATVTDGNGPERRGELEDSERSAMKPSCAPVPGLGDPATDTSSYSLDFPWL